MLQFFLFHSIIKKQSKNKEISRRCNRILCSFCVPCVVSSTMITVYILLLCLSNNGGKLVGSNWIFNRYIPMLSVKLKPKESKIKIDRNNSKKSVFRCGFPASAGFFLYSLLLLTALERKIVQTKIQCCGHCYSYVRFYGQTHIGFSVPPTMSIKPKSQMLYLLPPLLRWN